MKKCTSRSPQLCSKEPQSFLRMYAKSPKASSTRLSWEWNSAVVKPTTAKWTRILAVKYCKHIASTRADCNRGLAPCNYVNEASPRANRMSSWKVPELGNMTLDNDWNNVPCQISQVHILSCSLLWLGWNLYISYVIFLYITPSGWKRHGNATVISRLLTCQHGGIPLQRTPGEDNMSMVRSLASWSIWLGPGRLSKQTCTCTKQGQKRLLLSMPRCWQINSPCLNLIPSTFNTLSLSAQLGMVAEGCRLFPLYCIVNVVVTNGSKSSCVLTARSISLSTLIAWEKDSLPHNAGICRNDSMHGAQLEKDGTMNMMSGIWCMWVASREENLVIVWSYLTGENCEVLARNPWTSMLLLLNC